MKHILTSVALIAALGACSGKPLFDGPLFDRTAPDEFSVLSAQPLTMPPEFRLPEPGEETVASRRRNEADRVNTALLRGEQPAKQQKPDGISAGESAFLQRLANDAPAAPAVKKQPDEKKNSYLLPRFFGGADKNSAEIIDPAAERARIEEAKKKDEDITGDGAESYKEGKKGLLQRWFKD